MKLPQRFLSRGQPEHHPDNAAMEQATRGCRVRFRNPGNQSWLMVSVLILSLVAFSGCKSFFQPDIPTGVEKRTLDNGNLELIVTGKASNLAIDKDSVAMKQTTSREAARLLLEVELQSGNYPGHKERFEIQSVEFLYDFEYCIIKGTYKNN